MNVQDRISFQPLEKATLMRAGTLKRGRTLDMGGRRLESQAFVALLEKLHCADGSEKDGRRGDDELPKSWIDWRLLSADLCPLGRRMQIGSDSHTYLIGVFFGLGGRCL
jgi:hypothetical protein